MDLFPFLDLKQKVLEFLTLKKSPQYLSVQLKPDQSVLTELDLLISQEVHSWQKDKANLALIDEEKPDQQVLSYPCLVLDPIDGTREFSKGIPECCVSMAYLNSKEIHDPKNWSWLWNPLNKAEFFSHEKSSFATSHSEPQVGLVSRTEWEKGLKDRAQGDLKFFPKGSIAYKLALLSAGACDFVFSLRDKHIWDIMGGMILLSRQNIETFCPQGPKTQMDKIHWKGPFLWCRPQDLKKIQTYLHQLFPDVGFNELQG